MNSCTRSPSSSSSTSCGSRQALDVLVAVARQPDLDLVFAVQRKRVRNDGAAARAERQPVEVLLLRQVRRKHDRVAAGRARRAARPPAG